MVDWDEREFEPDIEEGDEPRPQKRDAAVDAAKVALHHYLTERAEEIFYQRQLQIIFEAQFFHWITAYALSELTSDGYICSDALPLAGTGTITIYRAKTHRYWRRQARELISLVSQFSHGSFTRALGRHGELMFDAALPIEGFQPTGRGVRAYGGREWTETHHDLDRVFERDGVAYGVEIKNTLSYIEREELEIKVRMCKHLGLRPLFIVRMAPKNYINDVWERGGYTLVFKYQLYPHGQEAFAETVRENLQLPVDCPARIAEGTVQRFLKWHLRTLPKTGGNV